MSGDQEKPKLTKEERAARSAAWAAKREAAAERRKLAEIRDRKAKAIREGAAKRLRAMRHEQAAAGITAHGRAAARRVHLAAAAKRERHRVEALVLGRKPEPEPAPKKPIGMSKQEWKAEKARINRDRAEQAAEADRFHGKAATPQTLAAISRTHEDCIEKLVRKGDITKDQQEWAAQIANVYRSIEADVGIKVASFEARIDQSRRFGQIAERIHRVRMHRAYTIWREQLPAPKGLVLDMVVGDTVGYTVSAVRYRVHNRRAKRELIAAIHRWPLCVAQAFSAIDDFMVYDMNRAVAPSWPAGITPLRRISNNNYQLARAYEVDRDKTDEPFLLPYVDPEFFDERGILRPFSEIAEIVRERVFGSVEAA